MRQAIILALILAGPAPAAGQPAPAPATCTARGAIKVCETKIRAITSTLRTTAGQPVSLTVAARRDNEANTADALAYIGAMMMMLEPESTQGQRAGAMGQLIDGAAGSTGRGFARLGAYTLALRFSGADMTLDVDRTAARATK